MRKGRGTVYSQAQDRTQGNTVDEGQDNVSQRQINLINRRQQLAFQTLDGFGNPIEVDTGFQVAQRDEQQDREINIAAGDGEEVEEGDHSNIIN